MNRLLLFFCFITGNIINAQIPVTDVAANSQLAVIQGTLTTLNSLLTKQNTTSFDNKIENYKQRLLGKDNFDFVKKVEDYMWKADEYLKKGHEIQMIYDKEEDILKKLQTIRRSTSKYGKLENSFAYVDQIQSNIKMTLKSVGSLVDDAQFILSDKSARMSTEGRREILKETLSKLVIIERSLDNIILQSEISSIKNEHYQRLQEYQQDIENSMEYFRKYNQKK